MLVMQTGIYDHYAKAFIYGHYAKQLKEAIWLKFLLKKNPLEKGNIIL